MRETKPKTKRQKIELREPAKALVRPDERPVDPDHPAALIYAVVKEARDSAEKTSSTESVRLTESVSLTDSGDPRPVEMDLWASFKEWKEGFQQIPNMIALVLYRQLSPAERAVYGELYQMSWGFGNSTCKVSLQRLAERAGMKTTATGETIKKLVSKGLVQKVTMDLGRGREQGNVYSLPLPVRLTESVRLTKSVHIKEKDIKKDIKGKSAAPDYKTCPDCQGSGFWYPEGVEKGVAKCRHERMGK